MFRLAWLLFVGSLGVILAEQAKLAGDDVASSSFVTGTYSESPSSQTGTYESSSQTGTYKSSSQTGTYESSSQSGTYKPSSQTGTYKSSSQTGTTYESSPVGCPEKAPAQDTSCNSKSPCSYNPYCCCNDSTKCADTLYATCEYGVWKVQMKYAKCEPCQQTYETTTYVYNGKKAPCKKQKAYNGQSGYGSPK